MYAVTCSSVYVAWTFMQACTQNQHHSHLVVEVDQANNTSLDHQLVTPKDKVSAGISLYYSLDVLGRKRAIKSYLAPKSMTRMTQVYLIVLCWRHNLQPSGEFARSNFSG